MTREAEQPPVEAVPEGKYVYCIIETSAPRSFGLVELSPADHTRIPKASYRWYSDLVHAGHTTGVAGS